MTYLERMRGLREDRDLKQKHLAEALHITQNTYSQYERGKRNMPIPLLISLCKFYGVSADYLLCLTDKKEPNR